MMLRARAQTWLWRLGWAWPVAMLLGASADAMYWGVVRPQSARIVLSQAALQQSPREQAMSTKALVQASDVRAVIAASASSDEIVAQMATLAQAEGIALSQSEYQYQAMADASIVQIQVTQPVHAAYPQVRRYVEAVLRSVPNAALDELAARRDNVNQAQLDARLRWSVWLPGVTP